MGAFHAYDIRGIYNQDFNKDDVYKMGFFLPGLLGVNKVLVGRDVRVSSPEIYEYLTKGITDSGADVISVDFNCNPS
jgi:Phosphomannomutase